MNRPIRIPPKPVQPAVGKMRKPHFETVKGEEPYTGRLRLVYPDREEIVAVEGGTISNLPNGLEGVLRADYLD